MCVCGLVVVPLLSVTLSRMPLQLYDLPFDMLEMIGEFYDDLAQREAASTLQAAPKRVFCRATRAEYFARILAKAR
jgi:hypothetical protein